MSGHTVKFAVVSWYEEEQVIEKNCPACGVLFADGEANLVQTSLRYWKSLAKVTAGSATSSGLECTAGSLADHCFVVGYDCYNCGQEIIKKTIVQKEDAVPAPSIVSAVGLHNAKLEGLKQGMIDGSVQAYQHVIQQVFGLSHSVGTLENVFLALSNDRNTQGMVAIVEVLKTLKLPTFLIQAVEFANAKAEAIRMVQLYVLMKEQTENPGKQLNFDPLLNDIPGVKLKYPVAPLYGCKITAQEAAVMFNGNKIQCIKMIRERTKLGLKEAKDIADAYQDAIEYVN